MSGRGWVPWPVRLPSPWPPRHRRPARARLLDEALTAGGVDHTIETYPAQHGFAVSDNLTYDPAADQRHLDALRDLFTEMLVG